MIYTAPFDTSLLGSNATFTVTQTGGGAESDAIDLTTMTMPDNQATPGTSSIYWHSDLEVQFGVQSQDRLEQLRYRHYSAWSLATALTFYVNTAWGPTFNCSWSRNTGLYTFTASEAFSITFGSDAVRRLFGFAANTGSATEHVGTRVPTYVIACELDAVSVEGGAASALNYEPDEIANHPIGDDGQGFGTSRTVAPLYRDWVQQFEPREKVERKARVLDTDTNNWTFQEMFEHCRGEYPFMTIDGFGETGTLLYEVFSFRKEGTPWRPERASPGNTLHYHVPFRAVVDGVIVGTAA